MKFPSLCIASIAVGLSCMAASSAVGDIIEFLFPIDESQVVPPTGSPGIGFGFVTFDTVTCELSWNISWDGLLGTVTAKHFHGPAPPGMNAGVQVGKTGLESPSKGSTIITAGQAADLLDELWYINIHTSKFPGGEIRGQVLLIGPPKCPWDLDDNNDVGVGDLLILLSAWGPNSGHPADFDGDDVVGLSDLLILLANWGPCL